MYTDGFDDWETEYLNHIKSRIRMVPGFPKDGIVFGDITTLIRDPKAFRESIIKMADYFRKRNVDVVVCTEARGFIFGAPLAVELGAGFVPVRKPGKLPWKTVSEEYGKEYGKDRIEIHSDAIQPGQNVLIVDDLLATGGTIKATADLVKRLGGSVIGFCFLIELLFCNGREKLKDYDVYSLIQYSSQEEMESIWNKSSKT
ncbi:adenine phosphoribosyltransferase [Candidatus Woesearchaeota archaeon]|nr:adenine phosphoribosyltransferase [Candidatus Woesearchaeota archaeon]